MILELIQTNKLPGDILLTFDRQSFISKKIKNITSSDFSHAALIVSNSKVLESLPQGVVIDDLSKYLDYSKYYLALFRAPVDGSSLVKYCMKDLGTSYGWGQIYWLWLMHRFFFNRKFQKDFDGIICSELIARGLKKCDYYPFDKIEAHVTPQDLCEKLYRVV